MFIKPEHSFQSLLSLDFYYWQSPQFACLHFFVIFVGSILKRRDKICLNSTKCQNYCQKILIFVVFYFYTLYSYWLTTSNFSKLTHLHSHFTQDDTCPISLFPVKRPCQFSLCSSLTLAAPSGLFLFWKIYLFLIVNCMNDNKYIVCII